MVGRNQCMTHRCWQAVHAERDQLAAETQDLARTIEYRVADLEQQSDDNQTGLHDILQLVLDADDKLLAGLQKLGHELQQQDPEDAKAADRIRETCLRYANLSWYPGRSN